MTGNSSITMSDKPNNTDKSPLDNSTAPVGEALPDKSTATVGETLPLASQFLVLKNSPISHFQTISRCNSSPDCENEAPLNFPSEQECEHEACLSCLEKMITECESCSKFLRHNSSIFNF
jgi:hypothetical protein